MELVMLLSTMEEVVVSCWFGWWQFGEGAQRSREGVKFGVMLELLWLVSYVEVGVAVVADDDDDVGVVVDDDVVGVVVLPLYVTSHYSHCVCIYLPFHPTTNLSTPSGKQHQINYYYSRHYYLHYYPNSHLLRYLDFYSPHQSTRQLIGKLL